MREINNILSKEPSYSEPIMYRIEKLDIDNNVIQNIFIPHFADEKDPDIKQILSGAKQKLKPNIKKIRYIDDKSNQMVIRVDEHDYCKSINRQQL